MAKKKVIATKNLPQMVGPLGVITRFAIVYMALDFYEAGDILRGVTYTIFGILFIVSIVGLFAYEEVDIFEKEKK